MICSCQRCLTTLLFLVVSLLCDQAQSQSTAAFDEARNFMVDKEIVGAGVENPRVIQAMRMTPRHEFVPLAKRRWAYLDMALPIGQGQTISPPFVVAYMTEAIDPQPTDRVLEIGTGSGYQAAVLGHLVREVYTIEIVEQLGKTAQKAFERLKYDNVFAKVGDGFQGWPEHAPFDKIIVTCSPERVPVPLVQQLREGGRMVIPVGERYQQTLYLLTKKEGRLETEKLQPTLFVPMTGIAESQRQVKPDPENPGLVNGGFEEVDEKTGEPIGWHYQRQLRISSEGAVPGGENYVTFSNNEPGRGCQALQGFPVDGRVIKQLELTLDAKGNDIRPGMRGGAWPSVAITFFGPNRNYLKEVHTSPWRGTFDWQPERAVIDVPPLAREAIIRIGLQGALGELSLDNIEIKPRRAR